MKIASLHALPLDWLRGTARVVLLCAAAVVMASVLSQQALMQRLEIGLSDHAAYSTPVAPRNAAVLIAVDEATIEQTGKYPYDRGLMAKTLDILRDAGAQRVYFDASLNYPEDPTGDDALEAALQRFGKDRVALPVSRIAADAGSSRLTQPLERFARHATLVTTEFIFDPDRRIRRISTLPDVDAIMTPAWIFGGASANGRHEMRLNYAMDVPRFRRLNLLDVAAGRIPASEFKDRPVIIGLQIAATQFRLATPIHNYLSRLDFLGVALETLASGHELASVSRLQVALFSLAAALLFALMVLRLTPLMGFVVCLLFVMTWLVNVDRLQNTLQLLLPILPPPLTILIVWQGLKMRDSAPTRWLKRLWQRFVGVGKSSLIAALDVIADPALIVDQAGQVVATNVAFDQLNLTTGPDGKPARPTTILGLPLEIAQALGKSGPVGKAVHAEVVVTPEKGAKRHFDVMISSIETMTGRLAIASFKDVTEARERELSLSRLAFKDALTGLSNRVAFQAKLQAMGASSTPFGVLLIDLDGFKAINDTLGHHAGDLLLQGVARRIEGLLRQDDIAARLGGDEFAILVASGELNASIMVAERLLRALREPFDLEGAPGRVGASIGIALGPRHHSDPQEVLKLADVAMYAAKKVKPAYAVHQPEAPANVVKLAA